MGEPPFPGHDGPERAGPTGPTGPTAVVGVVRSMVRPSPHDREIVRLAVPALGALIAEPLYILADTAVVGHLGTDALAGLAVASSALLLLYSVFIFLAYGTTAAVARLLGAGEDGEAAHQAVQSMWLAVAIGVAVGVVGIAVAPWVLGIFGAADAVLDNATVYFRISMLGLPATLLVLAGTGYLRGLQDTKTPLIVAVVSAAGNLALELALIPGLGFGIGASAFATVLAQTGAGAVYVAWVRRAVRRHRVALRPRWATIAQLTRVGRDLFVRTFALRGALALSTAVAARIGTVELAAYDVSFEIWNTLALTLDAIAIAGQAMIGRMLGASEAAAARSTGRRMLEWGFLAGVGLAIIIGGLHEVLPHVFTSDAAVIEQASWMLLVVALMQPVNGIVFSLDGILIGAGDMRFLAVAMLLATGVFVPAALLVLALQLGIAWLWAAVALLMVARLVPLSLRFRGDEWLTLGVSAGRP
jgi:putative MATE family efflux protein